MEKLTVFLFCHTFYATNSVTIAMINPEPWFRGLPHALTYRNILYTGSLQLIYDSIGECFVACKALL